VFVARSYTCFQSFGIHNNMNAKSAIEKLQKIVREKKRRGMNIDEDRRRKWNC
jgi:hypothetical protein